MEFSVSHSSLRLPSGITHQRCIKAASQDNNSVLSIKSTIKNNVKSSNFSSKSAINKLIFPVGFYGENRFSTSLSYGKDRRNIIQATGQSQSADSTASLAKVSRFGSALYKFLTPYALRHTFVSTVCLYARVLVQNPQFFKWSVVLKAFPGLLAMLLAIAFYNGINQIYDVDIDRVNKPYLPLASGDLSLKLAWSLVVFDIIAGLSILRLMNADLITSSLYCLGLFLGNFYSAPPLRFKRSYMATSIVTCVIGGLLHNIGVLYASTVSLGLSFNLWSPPIVFITGSITLFFLVIMNMKDITDVEGDLQHNIRTLPAIYGPRKTTFFFVGILLLNYIGAIVAAICMPQAFKPHIMVPAHMVLALWILLEAKKLDKANYTKEESAKFYQVIWKTSVLEYLLFPFI